MTLRPAAPEESRQATVAPEEGTSLVQSNTMKPWQRAQEHSQRARALATWRAGGLGTSAGGLSSAWSA